MKIQYCSDLHLEFRQNYQFIKNNPIIPSAKILVMAGDILPFQMIDEFSDFFTELSDKFEQVYWVPGNHEYYGEDINFRSNSFSEKIKSNLLLINNQSVKINDVNLLFSTLWSKIDEENRLVIQNTLTDFKAIKDGKNLLEIEKFNQLHQNSIDFITTTLNQFKENKNIVISHHVPTFLNYPQEHRLSKVNQGFATELHDLISDSSIDYWIYGHHHSHVPEFEINDTQLINNQLGYVKFKKNKYYRNDAIVEI
jgi:DNA repair exonuclease SbcCD nuclease subunit